MHNNYGHFHLFVEWAVAFVFLEGMFLLFYIIACHYLFNIVYAMIVKTLYMMLNLF